MSRSEEVILKATETLCTRVSAAETYNIFWLDLFVTAYLTCCLVFTILSLSNGTSFVLNYFLMTFFFYYWIEIYIIADVHIKCKEVYIKCRGGRLGETKTE